jgi:hypothetical protein
MIQSRDWIFAWQLALAWLSCCIRVPHSTITLSRGMLAFNRTSGNLPNCGCFNHFPDLSCPVEDVGDPWFPYIQFVYGDQVRLPFELTKLRFFYWDSPISRLPRCSRQECLPFFERSCKIYGATAKIDGFRDFGIGRLVHRKNDAKFEVPNNTWIEVMRIRSTDEQVHGHGTWFSHAPGSGIWLNVGKRLHLRRDDEFGVLLKPWCNRFSNTLANHHNLSLISLCRVFLEEASKSSDTPYALNWALGLSLQYNFSLLTSLTYMRHEGILQVMAAQLGYDTLLFDYDTPLIIPDHQMVVVALAKMIKRKCLEDATVAVLSECSVGINTCGHNIELRKGSMLSVCHCDDNFEYLNCG